MQARARELPGVVGHVGMERCRDFPVSSRLEWLETDGLGGFAMGTVAGVSTRRYHGLLVSALRPPVDRAVLLGRVEETVEVAGAEPRELYVTQYPGVVAGNGHRWLTEFFLSPFPTWRYAVPGGSVEKQVFMVPGLRGVVVTYRSTVEARLTVAPFIAFREFHSLARANGALDGTLAAIPGGHAVRPYGGLPALSFHHAGDFTARGAGWYLDTEYLAELDRGLDFREDLYRVGTVVLELVPGRTASLVATVDEGVFDEAAVLTLEERERGRRSPGGHHGPRARLAAAADQFRVRRADGSPTIIAGYPWFADWGRDTMVSLPGLLLSRGLYAEAEAVLAGFLAHLDRGVIPNRFPDGGEAPEYNTADATLWLFHAVDELDRRRGRGCAFATEVFLPRAMEILDWHRRGTHHGIRVDPSDGLLLAGSPGTQLTWMDARVGDRVVTPRHGKAVEINALYYNALKVTEALARRARDPRADGLADTAARVEASFLERFWDPRRGCLVDVVFEDGGVDRRLRPNQVFAVSLPHSMLSPGQMRAVVDTVERELLTPMGLRTLARGDDGYRPTYGGDPSARDGAYHQGTVWPWLIGPFVTAYLRSHGRTMQALDYCHALVRPLVRHLDEALVGSVSEVFDAEHPHRPGGAPAQAWSVAELYRLLADELSAEPTP